MIERSSTSITTKTKFKIIFLGDQSTGKTSIIQRFIHQRFSDRSNPTIGIDFLGKNVNYKNKSYRLQLWDTAGQQKFRSLIPSYLKDAICVVYVFDLTNPQSLANMSKWINLFKENKGYLTVPVLCGNKLDLMGQEVFDRKVLNKFLQSNSMPYFQVSAKNGKNIQEMFMSLVDLINEELRKMKKAQNDKSGDDTQFQLPPVTKQRLVPNKKNQNQIKKQREGCCT